MTTDVTEQHVCNEFFFLRKTAEEIVIRLLKILKIEVLSHGGVDKLFS